MAGLIDADALIDYCNNQKDKTIDANDIARFPTVGGWINVKDKPPEEDCDVLVYNGLELEIAAYTTNPVPKWYGRDGHQVYAMFWHFLPKLPKEKNDAET